MPPLGLVVAPWQNEASLLIGKFHLFPKFIATIKDFFVLLIITSLSVVYYNFASTYKTKTPIKMGIFLLVWTSC
jgi:hypothetical protein